MSRLVDAMSTSSETYCMCGQSYVPGQFMIECECCREWFHGGCVNVKVYQSEDIDKYHCPKCVPEFGPSVYKIPTNTHRQNRYEVNADCKSIQTGSGAFVTQLASRIFPTYHVIRMEAKNFTEDHIKEKGFNQPLLFENSTGLGLRVPPANMFTVRTVERHCGADREIDVIDVTRQTNFKMPLGDFVDYFTETNRTKILNVLSLEFSDTSLSGLVQPPLIARQLDWVRVVWPNGAPPFSPLVQKYCIMSAATSYTDFHIDFGGTTVWYHVMHGKKIFYLVPPTPANLIAYKNWSTSPKQNELFFGDLVDSCSTCILKRGQTLFIPTGWIHAVLTPEDSLVFGGNFLHSYSIELQLQINEIEKEVETPSMFRFPLFETIHWYAGFHLLQKLRGINEEQQDEDFTPEEHGEGMDKSSRLISDLSSHLICGVRYLATTLKEWNACKSYDTIKKQNIPDSLDSGQLVKDLSRELRRFEKLLTPSSYSNHSNKKKKRKSKPYETHLPPINTNRPFSCVSKDQVGLNNLNYSSSYSEQNPRLLYNTHTVQQKKSLKLTLPKPIMHIPDSQQIFSNSSQDSDDAELNNIATIASRSGMASYNHNYDSQDSFGGENDYKMPGENNDFDSKYKKPNSPYSELSDSDRGSSIIKLKSSSPLENLSKNQGPPPDYVATEHSILKSHLINTAQIRQQKLSNHWTISKSQVKNNITDSSDEQILFTNENLTLPGTSHGHITYVNSNLPFDNNSILYGPGMYSNDGNSNLAQVPADNYNPDFIIDRKSAGLGLPDYSPTKSINEYLGTNKNMFIDQSKVLQIAGNFANNSDPYSQTILQNHDSLSRFNENSSSLSGIAEENIKDNVILHKQTVFDGNDSYEYSDIDRRGQDYIIIDNQTGAIIKKGKHFNKQILSGINKGNLNSNDILLYDNINPHNLIENVNIVPPPSYESAIAPRRTDRPLRRRIDPRSSIYDYEDQDEINEGDLYIDESPKPSNKKRRKPSEKKSSSQIYKREQSDGDSICIPEGFAAPKNGIESLLQASVYTGPPGTDNQERDAVAGMLSISQSYGLARADSSKRHPPIEGRPIRAVHKDDEYVYPSLEMSSDDENNVSPLRKSSNSRSKRKRNPFMSVSGDKSDREDESWSPRARLGRLVPRMNRPTRQGSRREAVQAALRAARLKGATEQHSVNDMSEVLGTPLTRSSVDSTHIPIVNSLPAREPSTLSNMRRPLKKKKPLKSIHPISIQHVLSSTTPVKTVKFKKGMKTAKQRLGKILKIHKMMC